MKSIKRLRIELETPMVSDSKVQFRYDVDAMSKGSHKPDYTIIEKVTMADAARMMIRNSKAFNISSDQENVSYDYFIDAKKIKTIAIERKLEYENCKKLIQRLKNKSYKLLQGKIKKTEMKRLSQSYKFINETSV